MSLLHPLALIIFLTGLIVAFVLIYVVEDCYKIKSSSFEQLKAGLDRRLNFRSNTLRLMAQKIYQYKATNEFNPTEDTYVSVFMAGNKLNMLPPASDLNDVCLHKLATSTKDSFNKLIYYIPVFNHPMYAKCVLSYNHKLQKFKNFDRSRSTRDIIIRDVLNIDDPSNPDLESSIVALPNVQLSESIYLKIIDELKNPGNDQLLYVLLNSGYQGST